MDELPGQVKQFIGSHISSVAQLEVLLLLFEHRERVWTAHEVAQSLYAGAPVIKQLLDELLAGSLLLKVDDQSYQYDLAPTRFDRAVGELAELYRSRRFAITAYIHSRPTDKLRTFSDAFRLRRDR